MAARASERWRAAVSVLEVRDLTIRFGGLTAIDSINLKVDEWEIVGLMGPNGAGKTTAFNCITGFYKPNTGKVLFHGRDEGAAAPQGGDGHRPDVPERRHGQVRDRTGKPADGAAHQGGLPGSRRH